MLTDAGHTDCKTTRRPAAQGRRGDRHAGRWSPLRRVLHDPLHLRACGRGLSFAAACRIARRRGRHCASPAGTPTQRRRAWAGKCGARLA